MPSRPLNRSGVLETESTVLNRHYELLVDSVLKGRSLKVGLWYVAVDWHTATLSVLRIGLVALSGSRLPLCR